MQILDVVNDLLQTGSNGKAAAIGAAPEEQVKIGNAVPVAVRKIALAHGQLIEIAEHGKVQFIVDNHSSHLLNIVTDIIPDNPPIGKYFQ